MEDPRGAGHVREAGFLPPLTNHSLNSAKTFKLSDEQLVWDFWWYRVQCTLTAISRRLGLITRHRLPFTVISARAASPFMSASDVNVSLHR